LGLDPIMRKEFNRDLITHLQGEGRTVFYSSHLLYEVEPVADMVAIIDRGVIVKQAPTESLRDQVKRIALSRTTYQEFGSAFHTLDVRTSGDETVAAVDNAAGAIRALEAAGCTFRVIDLNLDEIFEAYVAGRKDNHDSGPVAPAAAGVG